MFKKFNISTRLHAILLYLIGTASLVLLIVIFKKILIVYKISTAQALFIRQSIILIFLLPFMIKDKFNFFDKKMCGINFVRNSIFAISTFFWYKCIKVIPVNDSLVLSFLTPVITTVLAVYILKEKVNYKLWICLIISFFAVILSNKPSFKDFGMFEEAYFYGLIVVIFRSYVDILGKQATEVSTPMQMLYYTNIVMLFFTLFDLQSFKVIPLDGIFLLALSAVLFFIEFITIYTSYKLAPISSLEPLAFFRLIFSMIFSFLLLNETIQINQIISGFIVILAFIYSLNFKKKK